MPYNVTNFTSANNVLEIAIAVDQMSGYLFTTVLGMILVISFVSLKAFPAKDAFLSSSFITAILAGMLFISGLITEGTLLIYFLLFIVGVLIHRLT